MVPLTVDQKKAFRSSIVALMIVVLMLLVGLLLANRPRKKTVRLDVVRRSFATPVALTLKLHEGATEVQGATADGFEGAVTNGSMAR